MNRRHLMCRSFTVASLLFWIAGVCAGELRTTIRDIAIHASAEQAGILSFHLDDDAFPTATPDHPVFLYVRLEDGAVLANTLVDIDRPDLGRAHHPIFMPIETGAAEEVSVVAPPDAVSIVRWVQGESAIWLRIQRPTHTWLSVAGHEVAPNPDHYARFSFGRSASNSYADTGGYFEQQLANLPYHTRQDPFKTDDPQTFAVSTLLCLDMRDARLQAFPRPSSESVVSLLVSAVLASPTQVIRAETPLELDGLRTYPAAFNNGGLIARGFDGECTTVGDSDRVRVDLCGLPEDRTVSFQNQLSLSTSCRFSWMPERFTRWTAAFAPEQRIGFLVQTTPKGDFQDAGEVSGRRNTVLLEAEAFHNPALGAAFAHRDNLFQVGAQWYAHTAEALLIDDLATIQVGMRAYAAADSPHGTASCTVRSYPTARDIFVDDEPGYTGPDQRGFCGPSEYPAGSDHIEVAVLEGCL